MQRAVLFSIGLAGVASKNPEAKALLRAHGRVVQLSHQCNAVSGGIAAHQAGNGVPGPCVAQEVGPGFVIEQKVGFVIVMFE